MIDRTYRWLTIAVLFVVLLPVPGRGQEQSSTQKLDPILRYSLHDYTRGSLQRPTTLPDDVFQIPVVIHGTGSLLRTLPVRVTRNYGSFATAHLTLSEINYLLRYEDISSIEYGPHHEILLDISLVDVRADSLHAGFVNNTTYTGAGVIIGLIDTGIDFYHPDFRDPNDSTKTRILRIWDISLEPNENESSPELFDYGVEYTREQIERDLRGETSGFVRAVDTHGHGTHVAGVAGGNGSKSEGKYTGVAPQAEFIVVRFGGTSVSTAQIVDGIEYIFSHAEILNRPAVINLSLGGHNGAHDGTGAHEVLIDQYAQEPGRIVVVAAGNSGESGVHTGGTVVPDLPHTFTLSVSDYAQNPGPENDYILLSVWYEGGDSLEITFETPRGYQGTVTTSFDSLHSATDDGSVFIYTNRYFTNPKGARRIDILLIDENAAFPPMKGNWQFSLGALSPEDTIRFNTWIVANSMPSARLQPSTHRRFTVTMPGTAEKAITVGAYQTKLSWTNRTNNTITLPGQLGSLAVFSGGGPTRDLRMKPDVTAPGRFTAAPLSTETAYSNTFILNEDGYIVLSGTSISTPHVTGTVALMLEANPLLKSDDILSILATTSRSDQFTGNLPNNDWGYGKLNALAAVQEAARIATERTHPLPVPATYSLMQNYPNPFNASTVIEFHLPKESHVVLSVFDILGRKVETLVDVVLPAHIHRVRFDASLFGSGIYFYRLEAENYSETKKMMLVR